MEGREEGDIAFAEKSVSLPMGQGQPASPKPLPQKGSPGFQIQQQFSLLVLSSFLASVLISRIQSTFPQTLVPLTSLLLALQCH